MSDLSEKDAELEFGAPRGWHSRGYLPHFDNFYALQSVIFRLADSLPKSKLAQLDRDLRAKDLAQTQRDLEKRQRIDALLDAGFGCCALAHPAVAGIVQHALLKFDGIRYLLIAWCIMPNHVHVLIDPRDSLSKIVQSWKSYTGRWALGKNAELELGAPRGKFWMREYWDRYIRDQRHFERVIDYIHRNPVKAGLCAKPENWQWSSAWERRAPARQQSQQEKVL